MKLIAWREINYILRLFFMREIVYIYRDGQKRHFLVFVFPWVSDKDAMFKGSLIKTWKAL